MSDLKKNILSTVEIGLAGFAQNLPYGSTVATWWLGFRQEQTNRRLESFAQGLAEDIKKLQDKGIPLTDEAMEAVGDIIEETLESVAREKSEDKIEFFKTYIKNTIKHPAALDFEFKKVFLDEIASMSNMECQLLAFLYHEKDLIQIRGLTGADIYVIFSAISRLKARGFIESRRGSYMINGTQDEALDDLITLSKYGREFAEYCILD